MICQSWLSLNSSVSHRRPDTGISTQGFFTSFYGLMMVGTEIQKIPDQKPKPETTQRWFAVSWEGTAGEDLGKKIVNEVLKDL